ncbi:hypothetical protein MBUL_01009 [Methylobacterium bullatum]|uniref:Uncharacterized protein n=1 Tax=Methylobacterium bullatum TaxID=570505 RepID=A0A679IXR0_9HYPH|nr:hypothetical protein MBUL_01009 [Methylobacterium bullatum]
MQAGQLSPDLREIPAVMGECMERVGASSKWCNALPPRSRYPRSVWSADRVVKKTPKSFQDLPPIRVRREPPTIPEAIAAAQDLADDLEQQVEIAAGLIGLPLDEVRPHVLAAEKPKPEKVSERILTAGSPSRAPRTVIVERRTRPPVVVERRGRPLDGRR